MFFLFDDEDTGIGRIYIISIAVVGLLFVWIPYEILVELSAFFFSISLSFFFYSFVYFKWKKPDMPRPFEIPGKVPGAILLSLAPLALTFANFYFSAIDKTPVHGIAYFKVHVLNSVILFGIIVHLVYAFRASIFGVCGIHFNDALSQSEKVSLLSPEKPESVEQQGKAGARVWNSDI